MFEITKQLITYVKKILKNYYTYLIFLLLVSTYFTLTPFLKNTFQTPPNRIYLGAENDYNTYFKYLKITNTGQNLSLSDLKLKLAQSPPEEKFYLINGKIAAILALSQFSSYHISRLLFNLLFLVFSYLIISRIFLSRPLRLAIFSFLFLVILPLVINFYSYPHIAFLRLFIIFIIFIIFILLRRFRLLRLSTPATLSLKSIFFLVIISILIGLFINSRTVSFLKFDLKKDPALSALIYPSKDFYEGIGYLRDNASPNEKVICLKRCAYFSEVFTVTSPMPGSQEEITAQIATVFDSSNTRKKLQKENTVYWFIGPEEKPLISPDFGRLKPKEVFKNKEVTIYRLEFKI